MTVSIIIIGRNEERHIAKCIESALTACAGLPDCETIFVDSNSTDHTVEIASQYPVTILQLQPDWRHTPAAGRFIGFHASKGEYLFFLDGDSYLRAGFLERALEEFKNCPELAAVVGWRKEMYWVDGKMIGEGGEANGIGSEERIMTAAPGSASYRRTALGKVGCFNPFLFSFEEAELGERLRWQGFAIKGLPMEMVIHNTPPREAIRSYFRRVKSNNHLGYGQVLRLRLAQGRGYVPWVRNQAQVLGVLFLLLWALGGIPLGFATGNWKVMICWLITIIAGVLLFAAKSRSLRKPIKYGLLWVFQSYALVRGFLFKPLESDSYPTNARVIKSK